MRIVGGRWRGRVLRTPGGEGTRPTADRVRQAMFDILMHAPWGGRALLEDEVVLDAFAGTGALGLEALSRGAARAVFFEKGREALEALRANVRTCGAEEACGVFARDVLRPGVAATAPAGLVFFDPPYGEGLVPRALAALREGGWIKSGAVMVSETGRLESVVQSVILLAQREHGAARLTFWRE